MPTFQTTPYESWIFPDEAYQMHRKGKAMHPAYIPPFDAEMGEESPWLADARRETLARVQNTKNAKAGMEGRRNTTARSQRADLPASRSSVPNGVFEGSPMQYTTSGVAARGGRIYTKEGQEWLEKRLKQRETEYGALSKNIRVTSEPISLSPYTEVNNLLTQIFSAFGSGSFTNSIADSLNKLLQAIIKIGAVVTPMELGDYARSVGKLTETVRPFAGREHGMLTGFTFEATEERLRLIDSMYKTLELTQQAIEEIARTIYQSKSAREQVMGSLSQRLIGLQLKLYDPASSGPERQLQASLVSEPQLGGPQRGPLYERAPPAPYSFPGAPQFPPLSRQEPEEAMAQPLGLPEGFPSWDDELIGRMEGLGRKPRKSRK